jgi:hypothetical protein
MGLGDDPFTWRATKDGKVLIDRGGRLVSVVAGARADRLRAKLESSPETVQLELARITGNYRRGNERRARG